METQTAKEAIVPLPDSPFPAELEESLEGFSLENDTFLAEIFDEVKSNLPVSLYSLIGDVGKSQNKCIL